MIEVGSLEEVTADWLSGRLRSADCLPAGRVAHVEQMQVFSHNAMSARLALSYTDNAEVANAPARLFVKIARPDAPWNEVEFLFYTRVAAAMRAERPDVTWPFPRCYDAAHDAESQRAHLLLEDLSLTWRWTAWPRSMHFGGSMND
jgi:hypothetical protein